MPLKKKQQNYRSFYPSEPFKNGHFNVRHPVAQNILNGLKPRFNNVSLTVNDPDNSNLYLPPARSNDSSGQHGYEDMTEGYAEEGDFPDVRAIFMAMGPAFKANYSQDWIKLVDEYQVMMHALNATAEPNNGTLDRVRSMFKYENNGASDWNKVGTPAKFLSAIIGLIVTFLF